MNKKTIIIFTSLLIIGIVVIYYFNMGSKNSRPIKKSQADNISGKPKLPLHELKNSDIASIFYCSCGSCSDKLLKCKCAEARKITNYLNSLIDESLSDNAIKDRMVERYGASVLGTEFIPGNEEIDEKTVPAYYENIKGLEIPATLNVDMVAEKAKKAYGIAGEVPTLLMQMPCFCGCESGRGTRVPHRSLLDCFTDRHGEKCYICREEAMFSKEKMDQGMKPREIRKAIIDKWGHLQS